MALGARRATVLVAFATLYIVWGATYLAIRFAVETMPPLFMAGVRFLIAGGFLFWYSRWRGSASPQRAEWRAGAVTGCLLMSGNACVAIAEQRVPSSVAALIVAMSAIWMVIIEWLRPRGKRPHAGTMAGLLIGLAGVAILVGPGNLATGDGVDRIGAAVLLFGTLCWASGSIYSRHAARPASPLMTTAIQMLAGGLFLLVLAVVTGQAAAFDLAAVSTRSWLAFLFLLTFGSLAGFTAFVYLLSVSTPARVGTYAYVNPLVAVGLGWALGGEAIGPRMLIAAAVIVAGVAVITTSEARAAAASGAAGASPEDVMRRRTDEMPLPETV
jgi:drug/metabolite transporter (DMT)-like permease